MHYLAYQMQYLLIAEESLLQSPCTKIFVHVVDSESAGTQLMSLPV